MKSFDFNIDRLIAFFLYSLVFQSTLPTQKYFPLVHVMRLLDFGIPELLVEQLEHTMVIQEMLIQSSFSQMGNGLVLVLMTAHVGCLICELGISFKFIVSNLVKITKSLRWNPLLSPYPEDSSLLDTLMVIVMFGIHWWLRYDL